VRRLYDVPRLYGFLPLQARVTYVIDAAGIIRHVFNSNRNPVEHVSRALEVLRRLEG
jgi:peroxiredoxin Q/BCP